MLEEIYTARCASPFLDSQLTVTQEISSTNIRVPQTVGDLVR